jgi:AAA15 family ATPase/GTPase
MLIRFTVENFLSFNQQIDFKMIASDEARHSHHIVKGQSEKDLDLLRTSVIYGTNASGKSNLIKAIAFAKNFIVNGVQKNDNIDVHPFKLDKSCYQKPSRFEFEFRYQGKQYAYGFVVNKEQVDEEWLFEIGHQLEVPLFERDSNGIRFNFAYEPLNLTDTMKQELIYEANHTRRNLLFLTNCKEREIKQFETIYEWFNEVLNIIFPNSKPFSLAIQSPIDFKTFFSHILKSYDLGIKLIDFKEVNFEKTTEIPAAIKDTVRKKISLWRTENPFCVHVRIFVIEEDNLGQLKASKLITTKPDEDNDLVAFLVSEESDGTQKLIDFIPMLIGLSQGKVFVVDEIESSLHALLIKKLFEFTLNSQIFINTESQLIATTHEIFLLDIKKLLRKDEIWFIKKHHNKESRISSLALADVDDLDIMKGYINGRFGAIPFIRHITELGWDSFRREQ